MIFFDVVDPLLNLLGDKVSWLQSITIGSVIIRLLLATLCGGLIGAQRATRRHAAGFRTYILVSLGAAIAGFTNQFIAEISADTDIGRIGNGVVTGIGFLGAGTILVTSRNQIKGLTTAAALWASGCMGLCIGHGFYTLGVLASVLIFVILTFTSPIENYFIDRASVLTIHVELDARTNLKDLVTFLRDNGFSIRNVEHNIAYASSGLSVYTIIISNPKQKGKKRLSQKDICHLINELEYVNFAEIMN